jgi:hypothetical protein
LSRNWKLLTRGNRIRTIGDKNLREVEVRRLFIQQAVGSGKAGPRKSVGNDDDADG